MTGFLIAVLCGISNAIGGVGYKVGENGGVRTIQTSSILGFCGVLFFGMRALLNNEFIQAPPGVWIMTLVVGLFQFFGLILLQKGFQLGPLSLVWCAACLQFMPALLFAHFAYGEPLTFTNLISLVLIICAIISASFGGKKEEGEKKKFSLLFGFVLAGILLCFSSMGIALKAAYYVHSAGTSKSWLDLAPNLIMANVYFAIALTGSLYLMFHKAWCWNRYAFIGGGMLSAGMLTAFSLQIMIMGLPGVIVFALSYSASILTASLISTFFMHEKRTLAWYCTLSCSLGAILLMLC